MKIEVYTIFKNIGSHDCCGKCESNWRATETSYTDKAAAEKHVEGRSDLKYEISYYDIIGLDLASAATKSS